MMGKLAEREELDERQFQTDEYRYYYIAGEPVLPCRDHHIIEIARDSEGGLIFGCIHCTLRYIAAEAFSGY
jgi:hypothetical protein